MLLLQTPALPPLAAAQACQQCAFTFAHGLKWTQRCLGVLLEAYLAWLLKRRQCPRSNRAAPSTRRPRLHSTPITMRIPSPTTRRFVVHFHFITNLSVVSESRLHVLRMRSPMITLRRVGSGLEHRFNRKDSSPCMRRSSLPTSSHGGWCNRGKIRAVHQRLARWRN
jgi:hypothetical protein